MIRRAILLTCALALPAMLSAQEPSVKVEPPDLHGSRPLEGQTATAVVRDYLQSWQSLRSALDQNQASLLNADFIGTARTRLAGAIAEQRKQGLHTRYQDRSHDVQIIFYSLEGGSIEMTDDVAYDEVILAQDKVLTSQPMEVRYLILMTPAEGRWRVRVLEAEPGKPQ